MIELAYAMPAYSWLFF